MATTFLSPMVQVTETDNTTTTPQVGVSTGATVLPAGWGPVLQPVMVASENDLVNNFLAPNDENFKYWFTASNFLAYTGSMFVTRVSTQGQRNACVAPKSEENDLVIRNENDYSTLFELGSGDYGEFAAKYPGELGNSLLVTYADSATFQNWKWTDSTGKEYDFTQEFSYAPGTSRYVAERDGVNDEIHLLVIDAGGRFTGTKGTILEKYEFLSKAKDAKTLDGQTNFYRTVLKNQSNYVYWMDFPEEELLQTSVGGETANGSFGDTCIDTVFPSLTVPFLSQFSGGEDDFECTDGEIMEAYDLFTNKEQYDISLIPCGPVSQTVAKYIVENICEPRMDCVAFISPNDDGAPIIGTDQLEKTVAWRVASDFNVNSSYATMDCGWKYQYDKYNDEYRWIPLNGDHAGIYARTDETNATWWSGAGYNRGQVKNCVKLSFSPNKMERDVLYQKGINPVVTFTGEGTVLYGDKTLLTKPSAFDRMNVRRLFIYLEKTLEQASKYQLFEFNDEVTRSYAVSLVEPFLREVMGSRGITAYKVVCNESNNTDAIINANRFVMDIYVRPNYVINFISLNFVAEKNGSTVFSETA